MLFKPGFDYCFNLLLQKSNKSRCQECQKCQNIKALGGASTSVLEQHQRNAGLIHFRPEKEHQTQLWHFLPLLKKKKKKLFNISVRYLEERSLSGSPEAEKMPVYLIQSIIPREHLCVKTDSSCNGKVMRYGIYPSASLLTKHDHPPPSPDLHISISRCEVGSPGNPQL